MITLPRRDRAHVDAQINIVPYIDVMLVLLVIFMMTTPIIQQGVEVDLPISDKTQPVDFAEQQPTVITVKKNGEYVINSLSEDFEVVENEIFTLSRIASIIKARKEIFPEMQVLVGGDREVVYGAVMDLLSSVGVDKVGLLTESPDAK